MRRYDSESGYRIKVRCNRAGESPRSKVPACSSLGECISSPKCETLSKCPYKIYKYPDGSDKLHDLTIREQDFYERMKNLRVREEQEIAGNWIEKLSAEIAAEIQASPIGPVRLLSPCVDPLVTPVEVSIPAYEASPGPASETPILATKLAPYNPGHFPSGKDFDCTFLLRRTSYSVRNGSQYKIANKSLATGRLYLKFGPKVERRIPNTWKRDSKIFLRLRLKIPKDLHHLLTPESSPSTYTTHIANVEISGFVRQQVLEKRYPYENKPNTRPSYKICRPIVLERKTFTVATYRHLPDYEVDAYPGINMSWALEKNIDSTYSLLWKNLRKIGLTE